jgi:hypothetical protein
MLIPNSQNKKRTRFSPFRVYETGKGVRPFAI